MATTTQTDQVLALVRELGVLRPRDLEQHGLPRECLIRLQQQGLLDRPSRGLYVLADAKPHKFRSLAEAAKRVPHGRICLRSALWFHGLQRDEPDQVWMAIDGKARRPATESTSLRIIHCTGKALDYGLEEHRIENVGAQIYSVPKTVADCFKHRGKIGIDTAVDVLNQAWNRGDVSMWDLTNAAKLCRVTTVMAEHLENLNA